MTETMLSSDTQVSSYFVGHVREWIVLKRHHSKTQYQCNLHKPQRQSCWITLASNSIVLSGLEQRTTMIMLAKLLLDAPLKEYSGCNTSSAQLTAFESTMFLLPQTNILTCFLSCKNILSTLKPCLAIVLKQWVINQPH